MNWLPAFQFFSKFLNTLFLGVYSSTSDKLYFSPTFFLVLSVLRFQKKEFHAFFCSVPLSNYFSSNIFPIPWAQLAIRLIWSVVKGTDFQTMRPIRHDIHFRFYSSGLIGKKSLILVISVPKIIVDWFLFV